MRRSFSQGLRHGGRTGSCSCGNVSLLTNPLCAVDASADGLTQSNDDVVQTPANALDASVELPILPAMVPNRRCRSRCARRLSSPLVPPQSRAAVPHIIPGYYVNARGPYPDSCGTTRVNSLSGMIAAHGPSRRSPRCRDDSLASPSRCALTQPVGMLAQQSHALSDRVTQPWECLIISMHALLGCRTLPNYTA